MPELHGAQLPSDGLHVAIRYDVPDQPSRDALVLTPDDVGALLLQRDVQSIFALVSVTPVTWSQIPDGESTLQAIIALNALVNERVVGPAASNDNAVPVFDGTTGKLIKESLASIDTLGNLATPGTVDGVDVSDFHAATFVTASAGSGLPNERVLTAGVGISLTPGAGILTVDNTAAGASAVQGPLGATDTAIALFDGSTGTLIKESLARVDNLGNITTGGTVDGVDVSNLAMALALVAVPDYVTLSSTPTLGNERTLTAGAGITITDDGPGGAVTVTSTGGAPVGASYVTLGANATLTSERVLTAGSGITITDGGAGAPVTIAATATGGAPTDAEYLVSSANAGLSAERVLTAGAGISLTPAAGTLTVASTVAAGAPADAEYLVSTASAGLSAERVLTAGANITLTPAAGTLTIAASGGGGAPTTAQYLTLATDATLTAERVLTAGNGIALTDGGAGGALTIAATGQVGLNSTGVTAYTLALTDAGKIVNCNQPTTVTVTIPLNATVPFLTGAQILLSATGLGIVSVVGVGGVTLVTPQGRQASVLPNYGVARLIYFGGNTWIIDGDLIDTTQHVTLAATARFPNERVLTAGPGIALTDGGAGGALTIATSTNHAFAAVVPGSQSIPAGGGGVQVLWNETSDPNNNFTANAYTAPRSGWYAIAVDINMAPATDASGVLRLRVNAGTYTNWPTVKVSGAGTSIIAHGTVLYFLNAGDFIDCTVIQNSAAACTLGLGTFSAVRVG